MLNTLIYAGIRTPFGRMGGGLAPIRPDDLLAGTFRELLKTSNVDAQIFDDVIIGCANQAGEDSRTVS